MQLEGQCQGELRGAPVELGEGGGGRKYKEGWCRHEAASNERRQTNVLQKREVAACYCLETNFRALMEEKNSLFHLLCFVFFVPFQKLCSEIRSWC